LRGGCPLGLWLAFLLFTASGLAGPAPTEPSAADAEFFEKEVRPLLVERCWKCHGETRSKGGLKLTSRDHLLRGGDSGPAVVVGKPEESLLVRAVHYRSTPRMPPGDKLTDRQIEALARWVKRGVPWPADAHLARAEQPRHSWAFQPVRPVQVPAVRDPAWARSAVDRFILAGLEAKGLTPARPADRRTLLRRATFDLIGLPPTPAEIDAFLADDSPDAFARVVDRLLASPQYGERWGRHWLDVVRYADARDLIQLPPESDFREVWRYRDWVVEAFNRDLPYTDFARHQLAGDLLPPPRPGGINRDGLVATGMLALADFVPGDVDKDQMIADYVNDEIDVVGRAFLGLTLACARCHDHTFDPIPTEDYYALAGIFFSTRLIPGPVAGNTPLVRVPLLAPAELAAARARDEADRRRRAELEQSLPDEVERGYLAHLDRLVTRQTAEYLVAACEYRQRTSGALGELAKRHGLQESLLAGWVDYLGRVEKQSGAGWQPTLRDAAAGKLSGPALARAAEGLQQALAARAARKETDTALARACLLRFRADDPYLVTDSGGRVALWPNRGSLPGDARPAGPDTGPVKTSAAIEGHAKPVLRFDGRALLEASRRAPSSGSLFIVFQTSGMASRGQRLVGWEDSDVGKHGVGLMANPDDSLLAILRKDGRAGDLAGARRGAGFETVSVGWDARRTALYRNGVAAGAGNGIDGISSDPGIVSLRLGGPGSGGSPRFRGDVAEVRVYDRRLTEAERRQVEAELQAAWFQPADPKAPPRDALAELYEELRSPRGPFWVSADERKKLLPAEARARLAALTSELDLLRMKPPLEVPQAVVVQDGGPPDTRHAGFKDAQVYLRGNPKTPGKTVPRGWPRVLAGDAPARITGGSGRLQLADWLASPGCPLTARVMVNRIWQHHFGEGLVRTPDNFGERGERPTHPELLDYLAGRFVASGWSVKAVHRTIMLSAAYQQSCRADDVTLSRDPENRLFGRMNRRRLEAEAIRDALLAVAGRLDPARGGPPFTDPAGPRRTLYLLSARTGANTSDFGRLFDRADPGSIVARRGESAVAPQALFFLNDPLVTDLARALAARVAREVPQGDAARIRRLYALALGRPPSPREIDLGLRLLAPDGDADPWERYCHTILCTNEFLYID
jgi:mono/diheme cytochrome c family protein